MEARTFLHDLWNGTDHAANLSEKQQPVWRVRR